MSVVLQHKRDLIVSTAMHHESYSPDAFQYFSKKANIDQREIAWIGLSKYKMDKPVKCRLVSLVKDLVRILDIYFSYNWNISENKYFLSLVGDVRTSTNIWSQRWLTLAGKIQVIKLLAISKPVFVVTMRSVPQKQDAQTIYLGWKKTKNKALYLDFSFTNWGSIK